MGIYIDFEGEMRGRGKLMEEPAAGIIGDITKSDLI